MQQRERELSGTSSNFSLDQCATQTTMMQVIPFDGPEDEPSSAVNEKITKVRMARNTDIEGATVPMPVGDIIRLATVRSRRRSSISMPTPKTIRRGCNVSLAALLIFALLISNIGLW